MRSVQLMAGRRLGGRLVFVQVVLARLVSIQMLVRRPGTPHVVIHTEAEEVET